MPKTPKPNKQCTDLRALSKCLCNTSVPKSVCIALLEAYTNELHKLGVDPTVTTAATAAIANELIERFVE